VTITSGSTVQIATYDEADTVAIQATLTSTDPTDITEGEPLILTSSTGFSGTVTDGATQNFTFVAPAAGTLSGYVAGADSDESATVTVTITPCPHPINFHETHHLATGGGDLIFSYEWDSSTGALEDLANCQVGELVTYPGPQPGIFSPQDALGPPWGPGWQFPNPTTPDVSGSLGLAPTDTQMRRDFIRPYQASAFDATQIYRYHCTCQRDDEHVTLLGPLNIHRQVSQVGGEFIYQISKTGATAFFTLPGQH
jgi:hypothetical protein